MRYCDRIASCPQQVLLYSLLCIKTYSKNYYCVLVPSPWGSKYFRAAFRDGSSEAEAHEIDLEGTDPRTFNRFLSGLTNNLYQPRISDKANLTPVKLWTFADRYIVPKLQNHILNIIIESLHGALKRNDPKNIGQV